MLLTLFPCLYPLERQEVIRGHNGHVFEWTLTRCFAQNNQQKRRGLERFVQSSYILIMCYSIILLVLVEPVRPSSFP